jgi:hypothetical protein
MTGSLEYAQARLSARFGARPDELAWRRIEHLRELPALIDSARTGALHVWMSGIGPMSTPYEIDRHIRERWRDQVREVAAWMPDTWAPAVAWCAVVADLAVCAHLARGGKPAAWMADDELYCDLCEHEATGTRAPPGGVLAPLASAWAESDRIGRLWLREWERRLPHGALDATLLGELVGAVAAHLAQFRDPALRDGDAPRRALGARLTLLFRRAMLDPAAAFIYLALIAQDGERMRGELVRRAALPGVPLVA